MNGDTDWLIALGIVGILLLTLGTGALIAGGRLFDRRADSIRWYGRFGRLAIILGVVVIIADAGHQWMH